MAQVYDGKNEANQILQNLKAEIKKRKIKPHLTSIVVGENPSGMFYQSLKKRSAESVGASVEILNFPESEFKDTLLALINNLNDDIEVDGIMIQLPLPDKYNISDRNEVIKAIDPQKDVDGMRLDGNFIAPVVLACEHALKYALRVEPLKEAPIKVVVVGAKGFVGVRLLKYFTGKYEMTGFDKGDDLRSLINYDVIISCTGQPELIRGEMVKEGVILIDTGAPKPEFDPECYEKASFYTPVPGGIGPLTIAYLMKNLLSAC